MRALPPKREREDSYRAPLKGVPVLRLHNALPNYPRLLGSDRPMGRRILPERRMMWMRHPALRMEAEGSDLDLQDSEGYDEEGRCNRDDFPPQLDPRKRDVPPPLVYIVVLNPLLL
jgi:hypothetical protein